jgi:hypothetical protein
MKTAFLSSLAIVILSCIAGLALCEVKKQDCSHHYAALREAGLTVAGLITAAISKF